MIKYTLGSILNCNQKVLVHGCNNLGVMGSGVAKQIRAKWPYAYESYNLQFKIFGLPLGSIIPVPTSDGKIIVNAITQDGFGKDGKQYVSYDAIAKCFDKINVNAAEVWNVTEIAYPRIGAGLGGGNWVEIERLLSASATNYTPVVYDYTPS